MRVSVGKDFRPGRSHLGSRRAGAPALMSAVDSCDEKHVLDSPMCWPPPLKAKARMSRATDDLEGELGLDVVVAGTGPMGALIALNLLNQGFTVGVSAVGPLGRGVGVWSGRQGLVRAG